MNVLAKPTQSIVPVKEIRGGVVILKNGNLLSILAASTLNFALRSQDEQSAILLQFQNFLNSLDFSVQFLVQSRRLDINPYLAVLEGRYLEQTNDLMRTQIREYVNFIKNFTDLNNIMHKAFYVVVPYEPPTFQKKDSFLGKIIPRNKTAASVAANFQEQRTQLEQRTSIVNQGLSACGVRTQTLGTDELMELYYKVFNPGEAAVVQTKE